MAKRPATERKTNPDHKFIFPSKTYPHKSRCKCIRITVKLEHIQCIKNPELKGFTSFPALMTELFIELFINCIGVY
jgi:hypothetical protein